MKNRSMNLLTALCVAGILAGCTQSGKDSTSTSTTTTTTTTTDAANGTKPVTTVTEVNGQKQIKVSLDTLPDDMVICNVGSKVVTIGDYRRMLKIQQAQAQANISADPNLRNNLYNEATKNGVTLTEDEKKKLIETAKASHPDFPAFLKEKNITEEQFNKEVEQAGLVFKMSNAAIEQNLLTQIVSRALLASASTAPEETKQADATYEKLKTQSHDFQNLKQVTGLSDDQIKKETVDAELARIQLAKIQAGVTVDDKAIEEFYKKNQAQMKHNERVRLSRIVISAPEATAGPWVSVKDQVKKQNPKLEGAELDKTVVSVIQQQQQKALVLLGEAKGNPANFGKLANENSDEPVTRTVHNGGDMGFQEKSQLVPQFADAVWTLKPGQVLPKLVKTNEGFSIVKVVSHDPPGAVTLPEAKNAIALKLKQDRMGAALNSWIAAKQKATKIEFSPKFQQIANGGTPPAAKVQ